MEPKEYINKIRQELDALETSLTVDESLNVKNWNALELPDLIISIVDYLQPLLNTYEAVIYWHLFRKSLLGSGSQYIRISTRGLQYGVAISSSGKSEHFSYAVVQKALSSLEDKGVIQKSGDTNREGTLYKVYLPDEIAICSEYRRKIKPPESVHVDTESEIDYYNVAENRIKVFERDDYKCHYCSKQLTRFSATLDHIQPVSRGGDNSFENLVTSCLHCNSRRGNRPVMEAITKGNEIA